MDSFVQFLEQTSPNSTFNNTGKLFACISAHDDYLYAGRVIYPLLKQIKAKQVFVFGVTHGTVRNAFGDSLRNFLIFDNFTTWNST